MKMVTRLYSRCSPGAAEFVTFHIRWRALGNGCPIAGANWAGLARGPIANHVTSRAGERVSPRQIREVLSVIKIGLGWATTR